MESKRHVISVLVANQFGVLTRVSALFARRGFNIDSLTVGETELPEFSRVTIAMQGDTHTREQIIKQLEKLEDVKEIRIMPSGESMQRELLLLKVNTTTRTRHDILDVVNVFRSKILDYAPESITVEITGESSKLDAFVELMRPFGIVKMCRTGIVALERG